MSHEAALCEELPYWEFIAGVGNQPAHAILMDGSLVGGLRASLIDTECFDDASVNGLTESLRNALNSISEGTTLQMHFSTRADWTEVLSLHERAISQNAHPLIASVGKHRMKELGSENEAQELYRPTLMLYLRIPKVEKKRGFFLSKSKAFERLAEVAYQEAIDSLNQNLEALQSALASCGIKGEALGNEAIKAGVYSFLNPKRAKTEPVPKIQEESVPIESEDLLKSETWLSASSPRAQLSFGDLSLEYDHFTLDGYQHRIVTLKTLPEITFAGQIAQFLRLPFHYDLFLTFEVPTQTTEMAKLNQKRKMAHALAATQSGRASDLESESKLSSTEELIRELLSSGQRIYAAQMVIVLKEPRGEVGARRLNHQVRAVLGRFRALQGAEGLEESVGAWKVVKGTLPAAPVYLERARKIKTNNLADFLPVYAPYEGDRDPVVLFRNRLSGLRAYDPFDSSLPNFNTLVTGSSGAGKSFLNNCILLQELARAMRVFVIDIGGSYRKLTESLQGQYFELSLSDTYRINPFHIADITAGPTDQKIKSLLATIECMVAEDQASRLLKLDRVLLETVLISLYEEAKSTRQMPTLSKLKSRLEDSEEPSLKRIAKMLSMWTGSSPYGKLLDGEGCLRSDAMISTFDLKGLSSHPDLQSVMILLLTDMILSAVENERGIRKRIILDEAWELLKSPAAANFMEYCARTLRKTGSGITFITQGVEEIVASPIGSAILNNTATKFILLQRGDSKILRDTLKLNPQEVSLIHSLEQKKGQYSEAFMIEGNQRQVIRIRPGAIDYWISTSDARDNDFLRSLQADGMTLQAAIEEAATRHPYGMSA